MRSLATRDHLIETASALFSRHGFRAVGIDRLLADAGIARTTLYSHFPSKDALIAAVLRRRDAHWREWLQSWVRAHAETPRLQILAVFDALDAWFAGEAFHDGPFMIAMAEFGGGDAPADARADAHKQHLETYLSELADAAKAADPDALAGALLLLVEGAIVLAHVCRRRGVGQEAQRAAVVLLEAHLPPAIAD